MKKEKLKLKEKGYINIKVKADSLRELRRYYLFSSFNHLNLFFSTFFFSSLHHLQAQK